MLGRVGTALALLLMLLASCSSDPVPLKVTSDVVEKGDTARTTLLVYMVAENSLADFAALDVAEILEAVPDVPRDCRLFVYVDDRRHPVLTQYFRLTDGNAGCSDHVFLLTMSAPATQRLLVRCSIILLRIILLRHSML